ncbi:endonuclease domain-containing protein [candidate division KSB1 bacterium]|nr:endonuclease domain-containing protein [candidate division KSB1 bacterium]
MTQIYNKTSEKMKRRVLRNNMTEHEIIFWSRLKNRQLEGFKFRRQYSVGPYILDFYCPEKKLAIELDGGGHFTEDGIEYDRVRQSEIEQLGVRFLRFTNSDARTHLYEILTEIRNVLLKE